MLFNSRLNWAHVKLFITNWWLFLILCLSLFSTLSVIGAAAINFKEGNGVGTVNNKTYNAKAISCVSMVTCCFEKLCKGILFYLNLRQSSDTGELMEDSFALNLSSQGRDQNTQYSDWDCKFSSFMCRVKHRFMTTIWTKDKILMGSCLKESMGKSLRCLKLKYDSSSLIPLRGCVWTAKAKIHSFECMLHHSTFTYEQRT